MARDRIATDPVHAYSFGAIGTSWKISFSGSGALSREGADALVERVRLRIDAFDKSYSRFRSDSLVAEMARSAGTYELPEDAEPIFSLYEKLYALTRGKVTPLIGQVLVDAGYDAAYSLDPKREIRPARPLEEVVHRDGRKLLLKEPTLFDLGAIGKGYLIDIVAEMLRAAGVDTYTINAGGDIACRSAEGDPSRIGLEDPSDAAKAVGYADIIDRSICGSAGNRRAWKGYHHIIDPQTVVSPMHIRALWTVADTTMLADGLSTALFFVEPEALSGNFDFEYAILYADGSGRTSGRFPGILFTA